jgi:hypothetical protein
MATKKGVREVLAKASKKIDEIVPTRIKTKKPVFYMSALPSHKTSKAKYFTMLGDRVIVETLKNGVAGGDLTPEQEAHFKYLKKRFPQYIVVSTDIKKNDNPVRRKEFEEKIVKIKNTVTPVDKKLAAELIAKLRTEYGY